MTDLYNTLGVGKTATQEEIKSAYRKLASKHHPDRGGDTATFQKIQGAYDTLGDADKRAAHDNPQPQMGGFPFNNGGFPPGFEEMFRGGNNPFGDLFGRRQQPARNRTLNLQTQISLEEAFHGKELIANVQLPSGRDQVLEVKIPAGVHDGTTLRLSGMGDDSIPNMPRGDIHLTMHVLPHRDYLRPGDDLVKVLQINCLDAIIGKTMQFDTIDHKTLEVIINPGTQHGQILAVQGYGMPNIANANMKGRLLLTINIIVPTNLTETQKDLIKQITS
jgi:curved DNA-binding protein